MEHTRESAIVYRLGDKIYFNITNKCSCSCKFCIRRSAVGVGDAKNLWLKNEPEIDEIKKAFLNRKDLSECDEIVFCGFGEPMERADVVVEMCKFIKFKTGMPIRLNTNGHGLLINPDFNMSLLSNLDRISISLNADNPAEYLKITASKFGIESYDKMLEFASVAARYSKVQLTVVDTLPKKNIKNCQKIADTLELPLVVRGLW